jgi:hypothetical protein
MINLRGSPRHDAIAEVILRRQSSNSQRADHDGR